MNTYAYVDSNPLQLADPYGLIGDKPPLSPAQLFFDLVFYSAPLGEGADIHNYQIVPYKTKLPGRRKHHGILDAWSVKNIPNYKSRGPKTPCVVLTIDEHEETNRILREWRKARGWKVDWTTVPAREIYDLSEQMFDAANVPEYSRRQYYKAYDFDIYRNY